MQIVKIAKAKLVGDKYGSHIEITMVRLSDKNGKYIKFLKLDQKLLDLLIDQEIVLHEDFFKE